MWSFSTNHQHLLLPFTIPFFSFFLLLTYLILPYLVTPISFNYTRFYRGNFTDDGSGSCSEGTHKICLQGDAIQVPSDHTLQFTDGETSSGWAVYSEALPLWKWERHNDTTAAAAEELRKVTTNLTTSISFNLTMNTSDNCSVADGMAFFLSPHPHRIPLDSHGPMLGLVNERNEFSASGDRSFVAVEIDAFSNSRWDPPYIHVGINVNSIKSKEKENISALAVESGGNVVGEVRVQYNSTTGNLTAIVEGGSIVYANISYHVDLSGILPELVAIGISATSGYCSEHHKVTSWSFESTWDRVVPDKKNKTLVIVVVAVAVAAGLTLLLGVLGLVVWRRRSRGTAVGTEEIVGELSQGSSFNGELANTGGPQRLKYGELVAATGNFDEGKKLGAGSSGTVYRGFLRDVNREVAIKRVSGDGDSRRSANEYMAELVVISRLRHRNLVHLVGWCHRKGEFLLAYEYLSNKSLDYHLFGQVAGAPPLAWPLRYNIALGVGAALLYLHEEADQCVVHRDVKSSNVMLDETFNAKLGDFGLARLTEHGSELQTTMLGGTIGYMAPECFSTGKASTESDVYAFGVVALEIVTGRRPIEDTGDQMKLVPWVWDLFAKEAILEAADRQLDMDPVDHTSQMERLLVVGLWCAHPDAQFRPPIRKAMAALNFEDVKIDVPKQMPVPFYTMPPPAAAELTTSSSFVTSSVTTSSSIPNQGTASFPDGGR